MNGPSLILVPTRYESERLFGSVADAPVERSQDGHRFTLAWCGFGVVAAAALTSRWLATLRPGRALLVGIAGSLQPPVLGLGQVLRPRRVRCHGVGAGEGAAFTTLPFPQVPAAAGAAEVHQVLELTDAPPNAAGELLTVTSAAAGPTDAEQRRRRYPEALAEDMEAFGVALAAQLHQVPLRVLRGISNEAGVRDKDRWDAPGALAALAEPIRQWLAEEGS